MKVKTNEPVDALLQQQPVTGEAEKIARMEQAVQDHLFMADLREAMKDFAGVDAEWWEQPQYMGELADAVLRQAIHAAIRFQLEM
ncbi:MAG: hypothetical protein HY327_13185 [Chloroflexi bacterium]|nr:hypothetical protein [Chloroflexota bacterium]